MKVNCMKWIEHNLTVSMTYKMNRETPFSDIIMYIIYTPQVATGSKAFSKYLKQEVQPLCKLGTDG